LIVVDMQNDFCAPGGNDDKQGIDISMFQEAIPRIRKLLDAARSAGIFIVHIQNTALPDHLSDSPAQIRFLMKLSRENIEQGGVESTIEGSWGQQFVPRLAPLPGEVVVKKHRSSAFWGTNLDMILRSNGIETAVTTGCTTEGCMESTARDAMFNDYYVIVPPDCVASDDIEQHKASLVLMSHRFDIFQSADIIEFWSGR
ncbi:MAG: cysteine hydrolase, partial [Anaerolineales bacterium]|nr:cysteine hydrolase [Anaerolineales bacterium]